MKCQTCNTETHHKCLNCKKPTCRKHLEDDYCEDCLILFEYEDSLLDDYEEWSREDEDWG
jgi:hypothetical protein